MKDNLTDNKDVDLRFMMRIIACTFHKAGASSPDIGKRSYYQLLIFESFCNSFIQGIVEENYFLAVSLKTRWACKEISRNNACG